MNFGPYPATVENVRDGDTVHLLIDLGFAVYLSPYDLDHRPILSCRVAGINAPELSTDAGKVALAYAQGLLPVGMRVSVLSHGFDKYGGRFDGSITLSTGEDFGTLMIASGNAVAYP